MVKISRVLHAGYIIEAEGSKIIFDPILTNPFSTNAFAYPHIQFDYEKFKSEKFDAIFISHFHDDHLCFKSLNYFDKSTPIYLFSVHDIFFDLLKELGFFNIYSLKHNSSVELNKSFSVLPLRALDADIDCLFHIQCNDIHILNVVDSWIDRDIHDYLKTIKWDLILWPFQSMREIEVLAPSCFEPSDKKIPEEHIQQIKDLNPNYLVPSSCQFKFEDWSWYNFHYFPLSYSDFEKQINGVDERICVLKMNPGQSFDFFDRVLVTSKTNLDWVVALNTNDVDYVYNPEIKPQDTAIIARYFPYLNEIQKDMIHSFLVSQLPDKLMNVDLQFERSFIWCLKTFDQSGIESSYFYSINKTGDVRFVDSCNLIDCKQCEWVTEIVSYKLYSALYCGETLTSLYVRIKPDKYFSDQSDFDVLSDPLVQLLSVQDLAGYHKQQIKSLPK